MAIEDFVEETDNILFWLPQGTRFWLMENRNGKSVKVRYLTGKKGVLYELQGSYREGVMKKSIGIGKAKKIITSYCKSQLAAFD